MFFVFSKDKIKTYFVSFATVMILLGIGFSLKKDTNLVEVSSPENNFTKSNTVKNENSTEYNINNSAK